MVHSIETLVSLVHRGFWDGTHAVKFRESLYGFRGCLSRLGTRRVLSWNESRADAVPPVVLFLF